MNKLYREVSLLLSKCFECMNATAGMTAYESLPKKTKLIKPEYPDKEPEVYSRKYFRKKKEVTS